MVYQVPGSMRTSCDDSPSRQVGVCSYILHGVFGSSVAVRALKTCFCGLYRSRLADTKSAVAGGDPLLKTSEGIMRLMAASVMSTSRAQRCAACCRPAG